MSTLIDLSTLPAPNVIEALDFESLLADIKAQFLGLYPDAAQTIELESEPVTKLLQVFAFRELTLRARYNDEARAMLLAYAADKDLDHIGITYYQEARLVITPADEDAIPPVDAVLERDEDYRYRLALKPQSYSVAGPRGAYEFHARSASGLIKSVGVSSPVPGTTVIHVLTHIDSGLPDSPLLDLVAEALNDEEIRPLSESVVVSPANIIEYEIHVALTLFSGPVVELVEAAGETALEKFAAQKHRLETDIVRSAISASTHVAGVKKVEVLSPLADITCGPGDAAYCTGITIEIAAIE
jgi:phage-related baseplate assembly protein